MLFFLIFVILYFPIIGQDTLLLKKDTRPNILLIIADDLGFSDIGAFGGEIATPTLNRWAANGIQFNNFHTLPTCAPTRSVLLTGTDNHIAGLGGQVVSPKQENQPGYEKYLNDRVAVLPEVLKAAGYRTYHVGKWHLGIAEGKRPFDRGFQESFTLLPGGASHYADRLPLHPGEPADYSRNGQILDNLPADFYSTRNYTDSMLTWMERDKNTNRPFFAHLAYTAPHDPLHAPRSYIEKYKGRYDEGYEALRKKRFEQLKKLGLIPNNIQLPDWPKVIPKWADLSTEEKESQARNMEIYAAMIDYLDEQIGRIYDWLNANGELDNTFVVFMSDNGANGLPKKIYPTYSSAFSAQFDNSLDNRGMPMSFVSMEGAWATASSAAFKWFKAFSTEGGIRTPMIIKPSSNVPNIFAGKINDNFTHVKDLMPTFLALAKVEHPANKNPQLAKMSGQSLLPLLAGQPSNLYNEKGVGYELHGTRAYFKGDWKLLQTPLPTGTAEWELYQIKNDPTESNNLRYVETEKFQELLTAHQLYEKENGVIYDLPKMLAPINKLYSIVFWLLIAVFSIAVLGKISGKLKGKYTAWGYGIPFMYALAGVELVALAGLFSRYANYAAWFLLAIMVGAFFTLIKNRENWKAYFMPLLATILLGIYILFKSGWMMVALL